MTKRIPKLSAPEEVHQKLKSATLTDFCEVYIPMAPDVYTYGVPAGVSLLRGDVVWVQFATRKKPALAIVSKVHQDRPSFDVRPAYPHQSGYRFSERYMEMLEWTARYYISTPMKALFVFWPSDFEKYLDALAFTKGEASPSREPQGSLATPSAGDTPTTTPNAPTLTLEQTNAFNTLCEELNKTGFRGVLLHGVTGSGKTRVYQELALEALKQNKKVLILVPEIGLTPQTLKRFEDFLQVPIVVLHSALSAPKKREGYLSILRGDTQVVLGTRSAILAPFDFDLVILDEEHDTSFKQQDPAPRYHTREMAFHLAYKYGALVVLGSATPCLETFYNAQANNLKTVTLKERATQAPLPKVQIVDMGKMRSLDRLHRARGPGDYPDESPRLFEDARVH